LHISSVRHNISVAFHIYHCPVLESQSFCAQAGKFVDNGANIFLTQWLRYRHNGTVEKKLQYRQDNTKVTVHCNFKTTVPSIG